MTRRYLEVLRARHVAPLLASALLARIPVGIEGLAIVLFVREERGSFAMAGLVAGAAVIGGTIGSPIVGRLVDRLGLRVVLVPIAVAHVVAIVALIATTSAGAPVAVSALAAAVSGFGVPPTTAVVRSLWPSLLERRQDLLPTAYALDSISIELLFVGGPLLTAVIVTAFSPALALALCALAVASGTTAFLLCPPVRAVRPDAEGAGRGVLGALGTPGMRTLVVTMIPMGMCFGAVEVTLPAFGAQHGAAAWGGVLLATWSLGSAAGGFVYGSRRRTAGLPALWMGFVACVPFGLLPMVAAGSVWWMLLLILPAGVVIAPMFATTNELIARVAPAGVATEAYTWPTTAMTAGLAAGTALGGSLAEASGWRAGVALALAAAGVATLVAAARRRTLAAPAPGTRPLPAGVP